jgi:hypothetical protein
MYIDLIWASVLLHTSSRACRYAAERFCTDHALTGFMPDFIHHITQAAHGESLLLAGDTSYTRVTQV